MTGDARPAEHRVRIRAFQPADIARVRQITVEAFDGVSIDRNMEEQSGPIAGRDWKWRKARQIDEDVSRDREGAFVAELDGQVVGYITTWSDTEAGVGFIPNLAVSSELRGRGVGRRLIQRALDHFRSRGLDYARIETLEQNPVGQRLYPSLGFREVARQIHYGMPLRSDGAG